MHARRWILAFAVFAAAPCCARAQSYQRIDTVAEQKSFFRAAGDAFVDRRVHVHVPARTIARARPLPGVRADAVAHRGIEILLPCDNPSYAKFLRGKDARGQACVKGVVRRVRGADGRTRKRLVVHSVQAGARPWMPGGGQAPGADSAQDPRP